MPVTTNYAIPYPDGTISLTPLQDKFADIANGVDAALTAGLSGAPRLVTSDADRTSKFPSPVQGNLALRPDKGYIEQYYAAYDPSTNPGGAITAGWYPQSGTVLGTTVWVASNQAMPTALTAITASTTVAYCPGTPVVIRAMIQANNAASGAQRKGVFQLYEDGVALGTSRTFSLPWISGTTITACEIFITRTPVAGIHTYTVRGAGDTASAVTINDGFVEVLPYIQKA